MDLRLPGDDRIHVFVNKSELLPLSQRFLTARADVVQSACLLQHTMGEFNEACQYTCYEFPLELAKEIVEKHKGDPLPSDLMTNHDTYIAKALEADLNRIHSQYDNNR